MKKPIQKQFLCILLVVVATGVLFVSSSIASRQSGEMTIAIPFEFYLRFQKFSPGMYTVKHFRGAMFQIWNEDGKTEWVSTNAIDNDPTHPLTRLVFNQYGGKFFLREVYWQDGIARRLPKSSFELELAKQTHAKRVILDAP
jgi:hypothetical protein